MKKEDMEKRMRTSRYLVGSDAEDLEESLKRMDRAEEERAGAGPPSRSNDAEGGSARGKDEPSKSAEAPQKLERSGKEGEDRDRREGAVESASEAPTTKARASKVKTKRQSRQKGKKRTGGNVGRQVEEAKGNESQDEDRVSKPEVPNVGSDRSRSDDTKIAGSYRLPSRIAYKLESIVDHDPGFRTKNAFIEWAITLGVATLEEVRGHVFSTKDYEK